MVYGGTIKDGVVVLDSPVSLRDGTRVRVEPEPEPAASPTRGTPQAVLSIRTTWAGPADELDALLADVQRMRDEDIELQNEHDR